MRAISQLFNTLAVSVIQMTGSGWQALVPVSYH